MGHAARRRRRRRHLLLPPAAAPRPQGAAGWQQAGVPSGERLLSSRQASSGRKPHVLGPLWVHSLVEAHADRVLLAQRAVEDALHAAVRADLRGGWGGAEGEREQLSDTGSQGQAEQQQQQCAAASQQQQPRSSRAKQCTHRLPDAAAPARLGPQLHGAEPADVVGAVEHEAHHRLALVHLRQGRSDGKHRFRHAGLWQALACRRTQHKPRRAAGAVRDSHAP